MKNDAQIGAIAIKKVNNQLIIQVVSIVFPSNTSNSGGAYH